MKVTFNGTVAAFTALVAGFVRQGVTFEVKWFAGDDGLEGQAEIIFTGGF
jgi:hypothetical protein